MAFEELLISEVKDPFSNKRQENRYGMAAGALAATFVLLVAEVCAGLCYERESECVGSNINIGIITPLSTVAAGGIAGCVYASVFLCRYRAAVGTLINHAKFTTNKAIHVDAHKHASGRILHMLVATSWGSVFGMIWLALLTQRYCIDPLQEVAVNMTHNVTVLAGCMLTSFAENMQHDSHFNAADAMESSRCYFAFFVVLAVIAVIAAALATFQRNCVVQKMFKAVDPSMAADLSRDRDQRRSGIV